MCLFKPSVISYALQKRDCEQNSSTVSYNSDNQLTINKLFRFPPNIATSGKILCSTSQLCEM